MIDLVVRNAGQVVTCARRGLTPPFAGTNQGELGLTTGGVAVDGGRIVAVGPEAAERDAEHVIDAGGGVVLPGFIDCHTHAVFVGSRADEFEERARGASYEEIAQRGGGIRSSMRKLREASDEDLDATVRRHLDRFLDLGTTTIEAKSGYGLDLDHELRSLRALGVEHDVEVVRTCLAAHTVPPGYGQRREDFIRLVCEEIYPAVAGEHLAAFSDVFCERGVFSVEESERILEAGKREGLRLRVHADQLSRTGAAALAAKVGAITADHLEFTTKDDARAMKAAGTIAVLLPAANYILDQQDRPPARTFVGVGLPVAVATDFNPGSAPTQSMPIVLNLACVRFGLSVAEAVVGATINAACAIDRQVEIGSLEPGKQADLVVWDVGDYREIAYWLGGNLVRAVVKSGSLVRSDPR